MTVKCFSFGGFVRDSYITVYFYTKVHFPRPVLSTQRQNTRIAQYTPIRLNSYIL